MKKTWVLLIPVFLLACAFPSTPMTYTPQPSAALTPQVTLEAGNLTVIRLLPADGDLVTQLQLAAPQAAALGQHMFVEFDASW